MKENQDEYRAERAGPPTAAGREIYREVGRSGYPHRQERQSAKNRTAERGG